MTYLSLTQMLLGFKTELKLNNQQRTELIKHCGVSRHAWNWALGLTKQILEHNKNNPDAKIKFPTAINLHKWLVTLVKSENSWYYECSKSAPQEALRALETAWKRCFKKKAGQPRFKKKGKRDNFTLEGSIKIINSFTIQVPKIGLLRTHERLPQVSNPKSVTISRQADRWFISFRYDVELRANINQNVVGVDLGVKQLATLSSGQVVEGAKSYRKFEQKLARLQWLNRNKQIGSANWKKAMMKIVRLHKKIADIRKDTLHKLTTLLAKNHSVIVIEDLNVSGLMANRKLASAIADMGFYEFRRQLTYKCELYGSKLVLADRFFASSKLCSNCGCKKTMLTLSERIFECKHCLISIDRDLNASLNLAKHYLGTLPSNGDLNLITGQTLAVS